MGETLINYGAEAAIRELRNIMSDEDKDTSLNCNSLLYQILYSKNTKCRDLILSIASHCSRFSLSHVFLTQDDVKAILV